MAIRGHLAKRDVSLVSKDSEKRALSRFFSWCMEGDRQWILFNPAKGLKIEGLKAAKKNRPAPAILDARQCQQLLAAAERFKSGRLAPYVAVCLFGGVRPFEVSRMTWDQVNLKDGEIRLEAEQTKTGKPRVVKINATLRAWLEKYRGKSFFPSGWRKQFDTVKVKAGLTEWPADVLRHTAASHFFRQSGSYGLTAEEFGNSEGIIKAHYQGRVSSEDTKAFYALLPAKAKGEAIDQEEGQANEVIVPDILTGQGHLMFAA